MSPVASIKKFFAQLKDTLLLNGLGGSDHLIPWVAGVVGIYAVAATGLGLYWSNEPDAFDVQQNAEPYAASYMQKVVTGSVTTAAMSFS